MFLRSHQNFQQIQLTQDLLRGPCRVDSTGPCLLEKQEGDIRQTLWNATDRRKLAFAKGFFYCRAFWVFLCEEFETKPAPLQKKTCGSDRIFTKVIGSIALPSDFEDSGVLNRFSFSRKMDHHPWLKIAPPISAAGPSASKK